MGNKIDHVSTSRLRDGLDFSIADPADSPILDDQTVLDTLETGAFHLSDHSTGDRQDDADKDAEDHGATSKIEVVRTKTMLEEIVDETSERHRIQVKAARVSWVQRLLNSFRRD